MGTLLFTGIWYLKEQAELPKSPAPEPPRPTGEQARLTYR
ncbi:stringent starvation protein B [Desmospora sp. 8437]|nr:stringent starvation protein B [Desmospora sp. 8437]